MNKDKIWMVFDVLFVLILCFAILLATMLLTAGSGSSLVDGKYVIGYGRLTAVVLAMAVYFAYMLKRSLKWLREYYSEESEAEQTNDKSGDK